MKIDFAGAQRCMMHAAVPAYILVFLVTPGFASHVEANPLGKVLELLQVLSKEITVEGKADVKAYEALSRHYAEDKRHTQVVIKDTANQIAQHESDLTEAKALREGKNKDLMDLINWLAKDDSNLMAGRQSRHKERAVFEKNEATYFDSLNQLEDAIAILKKEQPVEASAASSAASASLISVAEKLKKTLTNCKDFTLSQAEKETLNAFVQTAYTTGDFQNVDLHQPEPAPSFLQQKANLHDPYGAYMSRTEGLLGTLQSLHGKVQKERDNALTENQQTKLYFKEWESGITTALENGKRSLADIKISISQSEQQSSEQEASLMESREIYKSEVEHRDEVEADFRVRTRAYKIRLGRRNDEAMAVHEATRILGSEIAKSYIKHQSIGITDQSASKLLQVVLERKAPRHKYLLQRGDQGVALLALKSTVHLKNVVGMNPFGQVKSMIKGVLHRLTETQSSETTHAAWCDNELHKTTQAKQRKEDDVQKLKDRLLALLAELMETKADINDLSKDMREMNASTAEAVSLRQKEHKNAMTAIETYKNAASLLKRGCDVLRSYYGKKPNSGEQQIDGNEAKQQNGMGSGIVAILELAIDDFEKLHSDSKEAEEAANEEFNRLQSEAAIRSAVVQKGIEWKAETKVKLELDESNMKNDLKSCEKALIAIESYMEKLNAMCIVKGPSHEQRKAAREAKLASLKEVLSVIKSKEQ